MNPDQTPASPAPVPNDPIVPAAPVAPATPIAAPAPAPAPISTAPVAPSIAAAPIIASAPAPKRGHGKAILAAIAIVLLALAGAGYAWAYRSPEGAIRSAAEALEAAKSVRAEIDLTIDAKIQDLPPFAMTMSTVADVAQVDEDSAEAQATFKAEIDGMVVEGDIRVVEETLYMRLGKLPGASLSADPTLAAIVGQWFFLSADDMETLGAPATDEAPAEDAEDDDAFGRLLDSGGFTLTGPSIRKVEGEYVREYAASLDGVKFADFAIEEARRTATTSEARAEIDAFAPVMRAIFAGVSLDGGVIRTSLVSGQLRSAEGTLVIDLANVDAEALAEFSGEEIEPMAGTVNLAYDVSYSRYGEPVTVEIPAGAKSAMELFGAAIPGGELGAGGEDDGGAGQIENLRALSYNFTMPSGYSYDGICASSDYENFLLAIGGGRAVKCVDGANGYSVTATLPDGSLYCVDADSYSGYVAAIPSGVTCR